MNIVVLVKQVPDTTEMSVDKETGTLIRKGVPSIINPDDLAGIEEALKIKDQFGAKVTAVTMGPKQASGMLRELLARGVDDVVLVTDRKFAGSDTWATSNTLAQALKQMDYDLIVAGRQAIDGDTAQVGPQTAEKLSIPQVTYVSEILDITSKRIVVKKSLEASYEIIEVTLPCLLTMLEGMNAPRYMSCRGIWQSFEKEITELSFDDLAIDETKTGLKSSPTKVKRTFTKEVSSDTETFTVSSDEAVQLITKTLKDIQVIA